MCATCLAAAVCEAAAAAPETSALDALAADLPLSAADCCPCFADAGAAAVQEVLADRCVLLPLRTVRPPVLQVTARHLFLQHCLACANCCICQRVMHHMSLPKILPYSISFVSTDHTASKLLTLRRRCTAPAAGCRHPTACRVLQWQRQRSGCPVLLTAAARRRTPACPPQQPPARTGLTLGTAPGLAPVGREQRPDLILAAAREISDSTCILARISTRPEQSDTGPSVQLKVQLVNREKVSGGSRPDGP